MRGKGNMGLWAAVAVAAGAGVYFYVKNKPLQATDVSAAPPANTAALQTVAAITTVLSSPPVEDSGLQSVSLPPGTTDPTGETLWSWLTG